MEGPDERRPGQQWFASLFSGTGADKSHPVDAGKHPECGLWDGRAERHNVSAWRTPRAESPSPGHGICRHHASQPVYGVIAGSASKVGQ